MRKMIFTLAVVLLAAPAWADVEIILTDLGDGVIEISYDASTETELVRAFALNIEATDGNIIDINDFVVGDNNGGYGIAPGSFRDNITVNPTTGMVDSWVGNPNPYTPVAPAGDPDALGGIGTGGVTIEMGSLYEDPGNAPDPCGVLCTITVDENVSEVCVTGNAIRGNVVLESAAEATLNPAEVCILMDCFPSSAAYASQYDRWVALGKPECWCGVDVVPTNSGNQCEGDAANDTHSRGYIVYTTDLTKLSDAWKLKVNADGSLPPELDPCADFMHDVHSRGYVVYTTDLGILSTNWKKKAGTPPTGLVSPGGCPYTDAINYAR
jgi:hypothetical protein